MQVIFHKLWNNIKSSGNLLLIYLNAYETKEAIIKRKLFNSAIAILLEKIITPICLLFYICVLFITIAWIGVYIYLATWLKFVLLFGFIAPFLFVLWQLKNLKWPDKKEQEKRLDKTSLALHEPFATIDDNLIFTKDQKTKALWELHKLRAQDEALNLNTTLPDIKLREKDPFALRFVLLLAFFLCLLIPAQERDFRLKIAFDLGYDASLIPPRLDIWLDPPSYTGRAPIFLSQNSLKEKKIEAPVGSILTVRSSSDQQQGETTKKALLKLNHGDGLISIPEKGNLSLTSKSQANINNGTSSNIDKNINIEQRILLKNSQLSVSINGKEQANIIIVVLPDKSPKVLLKEAFAEYSKKDDKNSAGIRLDYVMDDDYAIAKAEIIIEPVKSYQKKVKNVSAPLFPSPTSNIPLEIGENSTNIPTEESAWAGEEVKISIKVADDIGQMAISEERVVLLPSPPFRKPLPRALIELRRKLNFEPYDQTNIKFIFSALLSEPETFYPNIGEYIAFDLLRAKFYSAKNEDKLRELSNEIFQLAKFLEDGGLSEQQKRLKEAQARLQDAIDRNASAQEIKHLTQEYQKAMQDFLQNLAKNENSKKDKGENTPSQTITEQDLAEILKRIEEKIAKGEVEEAKEMLEKLGQILSNLKMAEQDSSPSSSQSMQKNLQDLSNLRRDQKEIYDETFQKGQKDALPSEEKQGDKNDNLSDKQQQLQDRLKKLQDNLEKNEDFADNKSLNEAEKGMKEAQEQLEKGTPEKSLEGQEKAIQNLGELMDVISKELQNQQTNNMDEGGSPLNKPDEKKSTTEQKYDPLGRPLRDKKQRGRDASSTDTLSQQERNASLAERILGEVRRRLGENGRTKQELEYLERLLKSQ